MGEAMKKLKLSWRPPRLGETSNIEHLLWKVADCGQSKTRRQDMSFAKKKTIGAILPEPLEDRIFLPFAPTARLLEKE